ncbi:ribosome-associated translation inhibitor RaiA [Clostridium estertheticum]|uniref:ribosome hibernation-promoting factor, HPF/YfiA family n=1 Tax=Clostridium estertheticum TaxID=238834 RepID=UPI001CF254EE|nr:ribosome-associated translation inhibitor RaiA [Clostridium estertheticum]MCB2306345.1 ribosome-associated translation inhibitor RaiA [Clostridium estertheticum]MCB2344721.1 ribosome-associated translation inhibitor RaiA [Clostridium estertheticum]MCB2349644.1 ribosome-associated translation inhibitor RaiA [Clostridium estertheticum]WAG46806.1 ribosome-associated translation inhibitor RaiA [Clostridium estertheticum]
MKIKIVGKNMEVTEALRNMIDKKVSRLDKYFNPDVEAQTTMSVHKNRHTIEITIPFNGVVLRSEEVNDDMYTSLDLVVDKLERQIRKNKTKLEKRNKGTSLKFQGIQQYDNSEDNGLEPKIVKTKKFAFKPMSAEEAVLQMELVGHSFFVYMSDGSTEVNGNSEVNVVYKRKDGNYGLIEPQF